MRPGGDAELLDILGTGCSWLHVIVRSQRIMEVARARADPLSLRTVFPSTTAVVSLCHVQESRGVDIQVQHHHCRLPLLIQPGLLGLRGPVKIWQMRLCVIISTSNPLPAFKHIGQEAEEGMQLSSGLSFAWYIRHRIIDIETSENACISGRARRGWTLVRPTSVAAWFSTLAPRARG